MLIQARNDIVALLDTLAKNPEPPKLGLTDDVRELYTTKLTTADVMAGARHFYNLRAQDQQTLKESVGRNDGEFQAWFATQYWLMRQGQPSALDGFQAWLATQDWLTQQGQPNALDGGEHGEPALA